MDVAIVGCGFIAQAYAEALAAAPGVQLTATMDLAGERAKTLAAAYDAKAYASLDALLEHTTAPLIVNLTIHHAHAEVTRTCLKAGRHVFSEKPLASSAAEAHALVDLAAAEGLRLGAAPAASLFGDAQQLAWRYLREDRLGAVRMVYADANLGRVPEWNANPEPFLRIGPLLDGAVYPLTLLTAWLGPVVAVEAAHQARLNPDFERDGARVTIDTPDHHTAMLRFASGARARLTASFFVPHQTQHFNSLEFHGDDGSLYLRNAGDLAWMGDGGDLQFARLGDPYQPLVLPKSGESFSYATPIVDMAEAIADGRAPVANGRQAAHVVEIVEAIASVANTGQPQALESKVEAPAPRAWAAGAVPGHAFGETPAVPAVGFGCSRYRGGTTYVDLERPIAQALDSGCRLLDLAELYGTETLVGDILQRRGSPQRQDMYLLGKVWNTNHAYDDVLAACRQSLDALGIDAFDCYMMHWPDAWVHQGPLGDLSTRSHEEAQALTFPTDGNGDILVSDVPVEETWRAMEALVDRGWTRTLGISNFDEEQLARVVTLAATPPRIHQFERHPHRPNHALVEATRRYGLIPMAHSPLSAEGLLQEPVLRDIAKRHAVSPAQVVLRWNVQQGIVPIPSSTNAAHIAANLNVFGFELSSDEIQAIDAMAKDR
ncbi:MAG: Gfo/Idh/MocA family oxidoreductase [Bacteroidetes bacterium]|jgi:alcohol dehydrogenase (NADP+)|nr:Gfo/Idh/MocA family oxidoreductase [Bacteroidota bacterium]